MSAVVLVELFAESLPFGSCGVGDRFCSFGTDAEGWMATPAAGPLRLPLAVSSVCLGFAHLRPSSYTNGVFKR